MEYVTEAQTQTFFQSKQFLSFLSNVKNKNLVDLLNKEILIQKKEEEKKKIKKDIYEGDILNGQKHGFGKMIHKNGDIYEGHWKNNKKDGIGKMTYKHGIFEGTYIDNDRIYGKYINLSRNETFEGYYIKDERILGKTIYKNGDIYDGGYIKKNIKHLKHGYGTIIYKNSHGDCAKYDGLWEMDKKEGFGTCVYKDGLSISAYYEKDKITNGNFIVKNTLGDTFYGYLEPMLKNCVLELVNGDKYEYNLAACKQIIMHYFGNNITVLFGVTPNAKNRYYDSDSDSDSDSYSDSDSDYENNMIINIPKPTDNKILSSGGYILSPKNIFQSNPNIVKFYDNSTKMTYIQKWEKKIIVKTIKWPLNTYEIEVDIKMCEKDNDKEANALCPISYEIMINPVKTSCGHIFEKKNLIRHFNTLKKMLCPICKQNIWNLTNHPYDYECRYYINGVKVGKDICDEIVEFFS
jgi:hypothetical protein